MNDKLDSALVGAVVGVPFGLLASYLFWIWLSKGLAPRIVWSDKISIDSSWPGGSIKYRLKIMNVGRRDAVEFSAVCMLRVSPTVTGGNWRLVKLRTLDVPLPILRPKQGRIITVKTDGLDEAHVAGLPDRLRRCLNQSPPMGLQEVLAALPESEVVLYLAAYDAKSGTRRHYRSHPYTFDSFTTLRFRGDGVQVEDRGAV